MQRVGGMAACTTFRVVIPRFNNKATAKAKGREIPNCLDRVAATASAVPISKSRFESLFRLRTKKIAAKIAIAVKGTSVMNVFDNE